MVSTLYLGGGLASRGGRHIQEDRDIFTAWDHETGHVVLPFRRGWLDSNQNAQKRLFYTFFFLDCDCIACKLTTCMATLAYTCTLPVPGVLWNDDGG